ncbi:MAG: M61 family metallopeptidase [Flavobacteriales bacterium]|nr:M61 family metallopeptidase [Flavobacteriales bacterium]
MKYIVSYQQPNKHYIDIEYIIENVASDKLQVQLPAWRPGRYELGNFAKNVQKWNAFDASGMPLAARKLKKDLWEVETNGAQTIHIKYNYFAAEINAGSSYLDDKQLYINGVNCFLYVPGRENEACDLILKLPIDYEVGTGMTKVHPHELVARDFHELVDCPFIASPTLKHYSFKLKEVDFHFWFQGECKPDFEKLEQDYSKFIEKQIEAFGGFPTKDYHFLFQILTYRNYHGVEHSNSTVIALGPSYDIMKPEGWYDELLGVSSHELYHAWNVKQIRPIEMHPYDYTQENYTYLGYLDEGVTTYYGDKFLLQAEVFNWSQYAKTFNQLLERHYNNFGIHNYSVAQSSFDTWLDGYVKGNPGRKVSIYTEGALIAFITDVFILKHTNNERSLKDVMRTLYEDFAQQGKGVSDEDYKQVVSTVAGASYDGIYNNLLHGTADYTPYLEDALAYIGCEMKVTPSKNHHEAGLGIKVRTDNGRCIVDNLYPDSIAEELGLSISDEIIAINGIRINTDFTHWCNYFIEDEIAISVKRELGTICKIKFPKGAKRTGFKDYEIVKKDDKQHFACWLTS